MNQKKYEKKQSFLLKTFKFLNKFQFTKRLLNNYVIFAGSKQSQLTLLEYSFIPTQCFCNQLRIYDLYIDNQKYNQLEIFQINCFLIKLNNKYNLPIIIIKNIHSNSNKFILYFHGNNTNIAKSFNTLQIISLKFNIHVISYDYPGYGLNSKQATQQNFYNDVCQVINVLLSQLFIDPSKLILWGYSLGTAGAIFACANYKFKSLILQAPFLSLQSCIEIKPLDYYMNYEKNDLFPSFKQNKMSCDYCTWKRGLYSQYIERKNYLLDYVQQSIQE